MSWITVGHCALRCTFFINLIRPQILNEDSLRGAIQTDVECSHVGLSGLIAKPNKPEQQNLFLKFGFVGFRKEPLNPTYMTAFHISLNRTRSIWRESLTYRQCVIL